MPSALTGPTSGYKQMTGCQRSFTIVAFALSSLLVVGAFRFAAVSQAGRCVVDSRGWTDSIFFATSKIDLTLYTGNDQVLSSSYRQTHWTTVEAEAFLEQYPLNQSLPCWFNPWFTGQVTFTVDERPAAYSFWSFSAAALLLGGFALGNMLSTLRNPVNPPGHNRFRLEPGGGTPGSQLWFLIPMLLALLGASYALFNVARIGLPFGGNSFLMPAGFLLLFFAGSGLIFYFLWQQLYLLYSGSETIVEVSQQPLQAGQTAQLYVSHKTGRLVTEAIQIKLCCEQITRERVARGRGNNPAPRYKYDSQMVHDETLYEQSQLSFPWEKIIEVNMPTSAPSSTKLGEYPQIQWLLTVKMVVAAAPDFTIDFPVQVTQ